MRHQLTTAAVVVLAFLLAIPIGADVPVKISYQGRVTDPAGDPVPDGPYNMVFTIWSHETSSENSYRRWSSGSVPVDVEDGLCQYIIGSDGTLPHTLFGEWSTLYLGITIVGNPEIAPRTQLVAVPYAMHTLGADSANASALAHSVSDGAIDSDALATGAVENSDISSSAVTADKILDEPGIAEVTSTSSVTIDVEGVTNIISESIHAPAAGYIVAIAQVSMRMTGASHGNVLIDILPNATSSPSSNNYGLFGSWNETLVSSSTRNGTVSMHRVYGVGSQGTYTYYINATRGYDDGTATALNAKLLLMYFPMSYD